MKDDNLSAFEMQWLPGNAENPSGCRAWSGEGDTAVSGDAGKTPDADRGKTASIIIARTSEFQPF